MYPKQSYTRMINDQVKKYDVEINQNLPYVAVKTSKGNEQIFFVQDEQARYMLNEIESDGHPTKRQVIEYLHNAGALPK